MLSKRNGEINYGVTDSSGKNYLQKFIIMSVGEFEQANSIAKNFHFNFVDSFYLFKLGRRASRSQQIDRNRDFSTSLYVSRSVIRE